MDSLAFTPRTKLTSVFIKIARPKAGQQIKLFARCRQRENFDVTEGDGTVVALQRDVAAV